MTVSWRWHALALVLGGLMAGPVFAQQPRPATSEPSRGIRPEDRVLSALRTNPITAPYRISTSWKNGRVVLSGRVATKVIHDAAVATAGSTGASVDDSLVIDTAEAYRSGMSQGQMPGIGQGPMSRGPMMGGSTVPYVYPQPLFGVYDDPFYGFEPPYISYPPWWGGMTARRLDPPAMGADPAGPQPAQNPAPAPNSPPPGASVTPDGQVEMTIDPRGVAVLRGVVPTLADKVAVGQKLAGTQGVSEIVNLLETRDAQRPAGVPVNARPGNMVPPPPSPENERPGNVPSQVVVPNRPADPIVVPADDDPLNIRLRQSIAKRPNLVNLPVRVDGRDGVAYLSGKVPTVLEAMAAFRAVQQTRGVRSVVDSLEFAVPDLNGKNPLIEQGRPEDVEPYLDAQIRRQVGDAAHIDRIRATGDALEVRGTIPEAADKPRITAILRSMPLLRGYRIDPDLRPE